MYLFIIKGLWYSNRAIYSDLNPFDGGRSLYPMCTVGTCKGIRPCMFLSITYLLPISTKISLILCKTSDKLFIEIKRCFGFWLAVLREINSANWLEVRFSPQRIKMRWNKKTLNLLPEILSQLCVGKQCCLLQTETNFQWDLLKVFYWGPNLTRVMRNNSFQRSFKNFDCPY